MAQKWRFAPEAFLLHPTVGHGLHKTHLSFFSMFLSYLYLSRACLGKPIVECNEQMAPKKGVFRSQETVQGLHT
jgi:hypothetical protein